MTTPGRPLRDGSSRTRRSSWLGPATWCWCVDGSGWQGVCDLLKADGFNVSLVQSLAYQNVRRGRTRALTLCAPSAGQFLSLLLCIEPHLRRCRVTRERQPRGPLVMVGHSYGGALISEGHAPAGWPRSSTSRRSRTIVTAAFGSHAIFGSQPKAVGELIAEAAQSPTNLSDSPLGSLRGER